MEVKNNSSILSNAINNHLLYDNIYKHLSLNDLQNLYNTNLHIRSTVVDYIKRKKITKNEWTLVSKNSKLTEDFIREFQDKVDWPMISAHQKLSEDFIREFQDKVDWSTISVFQKLSEDFIREFQNKIDWRCFSSNKNVFYWRNSAPFYNIIHEFADKLCWQSISELQYLNEDFIREFQDRVCWETIAWAQNYVSDEFREEFKNILSIYGEEELW